MLQCSEGQGGTILKLSLQSSHQNSCTALLNFHQLHLYLNGFNLKNKTKHCWNPFHALAWRDMMSRRLATRSQAVVVSAARGPKPWLASADGLWLGP